MAHSFRLIRAGGSPHTGKSLPLYPNDPIIILSDSDPLDTSDCAYSVIIGNNGTGKSRLLGNIAGEFIRMNRNLGIGKQKARIGILDYAVDGSHFAWDGDLRGEDLLAVLTDDAQIGLPSRVIAVALTPVDKFPLEPSGDGDDISPEEIAKLRDNVSFYHYVGMRDRTNRASVSALLYRALESLGQTRSESEVAQLRLVFEMLGYEPNVRAKLRANFPTDVRSFLHGDRDLLIESTDESRLLSRLRALTDRKMYSAEWIREKINGIINQLGKNKNLNLNFQFGSDQQPLTFDVDALRLLRRLGALKLSSVEVRRLDGVRHDLRDSSSGELSILTVFLSVAANLKNGSLVLIDEPETSLHPEWQGKYLDLMREVFSGFSGCHFIFSTHSPIIVADAPSGSWVYSMDRGSPVSSDELLGRSPDYVMAKAFDVVNPTNYYLRDTLADTIRLVGDRKIGTQEFTEKLSELVRLAGNMDGGERIKEIVKDLQSAQAASVTDAH